MKTLQVYTQLPFGWYMFVLATIFMPVATLLIARRIAAETAGKWVKIMLPILLVYHIARYFHYSFRGDNADYMFYALTYGWCCWLVYATSVNSHVAMRVFRGICYTIIGTVTAFAFFISFIFPASIYALQDSEWNWKTRCTDSDGHTYETRRYDYGGVFDVETKYTFKTFRINYLLPIERQIDKTVFFDLETALRVAAPMHISITDSVGRQILHFTDEKGKRFGKVIR